MPMTYAIEGLREVMIKGATLGSSVVHVIAAVDVWGPAFRLTPRRIPELAAQAREAAAAISVRLGGTAPVRQPTSVTATA